MSYGFTLAERLRVVKKKNRWSLKTLAAQSGLNESSLQQFLARKNVLSIEATAKALVWLDVVEKEGVKSGNT